ncbi:MAG: trans-sulfuration enzyme family protein [Thermoplasmatota archaeon]
MTGKGTICVAGDADRQTGAVNQPLHLSSTFRLTEGAYRAIAEGRGREASVYTRWGNPTVGAFEQKMARLEGGEEAVAFSSGMAAIAAVMLSHLRPGDELVTTRELYGGTYSFLEKELKRLDIRVRYADCTSPRDIASAITPQTRLLFFESLTNPLLRVLDVPAVAEAARQHGVPLAVDATFVSPVNQNPLSLGADLVVHSASKYLGGHSDLIAGVAAGTRDACREMWQRMTRHGGCMDPFQAWLLLRSLKTLHLRIQRHNQNALAVARFLEQHHRVAEVWYPGLESHPQHHLARHMLQGYGGMVTFRIDGTDRDGLAFMRRLRVATEATSLGGVETLVSMPFNTSHSYLSPEEREAIGIGPGTVRLSVGVEDVEDLLADLRQALDSL